MSTPTDPTRRPLAPLPRRPSGDELRRLRDLLAAAGRLAEFGRFAAQQIHELRQPLFAIKGLGQLLLEKERVELDEVLDFARHIVEQSERLTGLVSNLRQLSVPAPEHRQGAHRGRRRARARDLAARVPPAQGGRTMRTQIAPDVPPLAAAPHALEQILINLLANALDAVAGAPAPLVQVRARVLAENPRFAVIEVADNGPGIAKAVARAAVRVVLHDQGRGAGDRARAGGQPRDRAQRGRRPGAARGARELERAGRHRLSPDAAGVAGALMVPARAPLLVLGAVVDALGAARAAPRRARAAPARRRPRRAPAPTPAARRRRLDDHHADARARVAQAGRRTATIEVADRR